MHRSSDSIGAIASALAKAQGELSNPEKSLIATIRSPFPRESQRTFRYASLASGLDIVRKSLGQHEIATVQTTAIDETTGQINLTTLLAHSSGEWISSDWPVCASSETAAPHRMGAALTYARRYALFALVGIAGEDDLDAPDTLIEPSPSVLPDSGFSRSPQRRPHRETVHKQPVLNRELSVQLRDQLLAEISGLQNPDDLALWAHRRLPAKNTLVVEDAAIIEQAYAALLNSGTAAHQDQVAPSPTASEPSAPEAATAKSHTVVPRTKTVRQRSKAHLLFVGAQPCAICARAPCDAHHLKFAQTKALGRKVSDEFTVPLCRDHHQDLHRHGNELAWWANMNVAPVAIARKLWLSGSSDGQMPVSELPQQQTAKTG